MVADKDSRITARVPAALRRKLEGLAAESHRTLADYIRLALAQHVSRKTKKAA
jgi:predicted transcriptional regulator